MCACMQGFAIGWESTRDHSKWSVSLDAETPIVCFADLNHMASQVRRGGGALCIRNPMLWETLVCSIATTEPCGLAKGVPALLPQNQQHFSPLMCKAQARLVMQCQ